MRSKAKRVYRPLKPHEVTAVAGRNYGTHDGLIRRLIATIDQGKGQEVAKPVKEIIQVVEKHWLGYPDLEPVHRDANDWLRIAMLAMIEHEMQVTEDKLRTRGGWHLWDGPLAGLPVGHKIQEPKQEEPDGRDGKRAEAGGAKYVPLF